MQATHTHTHTEAQKRNTKQRNSGKLTKQQQVACWSVSLSLCCCCTYYEIQGGPKIVIYYRMGPINRLLLNRIKA